MRAACCEAFRDLFPSATIFSIVQWRLGKPEYIMVRVCLKASGPVPMKCCRSRGAIRGDDLGEVQLSAVEEFVVEAVQYGPVLFGHRECPPFSPAFPVGLASSLTTTANNEGGKD
jgi:hypothetical protein